jgi:hypothetical protein
LRSYAARSARSALTCAISSGVRCGAGEDLVTLGDDLDDVRAERRVEPEDLGRARGDHVPGEELFAADGRLVHVVKL